jgi:N-acetylmuramoyl-L-alanine amidase
MKHVKPLYSVVAGSFKEKEHADNRVSFLRQQQIEAVIIKKELSGKTYYRVQAGAFSNSDHAEQRVNELQKMNLGYPFILIDFTPESGHSPDQSIIGNMRLTAADMNRFVKQINPDAPALGQFYVEFGKHYNIKGDIAFAQALHETDYLRFTDVVEPEQNNYCGLGATEPANPGASFPTPRAGVLAHIQHLHAYAATIPPPEGYPVVDPSFDLVNRGSAKIWTALNGKWAVPGNQYGESILKIYENMLEQSRGSQHKKHRPKCLLETPLTKLKKLLNR